MTTFPVIPDSTKVLLIDTSKWQDSPSSPQHINVVQMKSNGCSGLIIKASQGLYKDVAFQSTIDEAIRAELPRGAYCYYDSRVEPKRQAEVFANTVKDASLELGLWLDLEDKQEGMYKGWKNWYVFLEKLKELLPSSGIGIYTGYYYWVERTISSGIPLGSLNYFKQFPLWIAAYGTTSPKIPSPWNVHLIWQFTDLLDGKYYGVESIELDGNYFNGNLEEYQNHFKLGEYIPPANITVPMGEVNMEYLVKVVWDLGANTKLAPNTGGTNYHTWKDNETFYASEIVRDTSDPNHPDKLWAKISRGIHSGKYVAVRYPSLSGNFDRCTYSQITDSPLPPVEVVPTLTHTIEVYSDGSLKIDGTPYS